MLILAEATKKAMTFADYFQTYHGAAIGLLALMLNLIAIWISWKLAARSIRGSAKMQWVASLRESCEKFLSCCYDMIWAAKNPELAEYLSRLGYTMGQCDLMINAGKSDYHYRLKEAIGEHFLIASSLRKKDLTVEDERKIKEKLADNARQVAAAFHDVESYIELSI